jgi:hypothetical protein
MFFLPPNLRMQNITNKTGHIKAITVANRIAAEFDSLTNHCSLYLYMQMPTIIAISR